jgi:GNAT superfamily N-acetyltransferase
MGGCVQRCSTGHQVSDEDRRLGALRDALLERYLAFAHGGLHLERRDISAEIAEARRMMTEFLGREPQVPQRPSRLIHLWVVADATGQIVGNATREVGLRGPALVVGHKRLQIQPEWRRRGFGTALLDANREWYRERDVEFIVMEAEGDGSAFAARRGFDFDLTAYANRPGCRGLSERELRLTAIDRIVSHAAIQDPGDGPGRESVADFLERLRDLGPEPARQVEGFARRLPRRTASGPSALTGDELTFLAPCEIAAVGRDEPLAALAGSSLGPAVLARTGWSGVTAV